MSEQPRDLLNKKPRRVRLRDAGQMVIDSIFTMRRSKYIKRIAAITIKLPAFLKRKLEARARRRRSVSAQLLHDLEAVAGTMNEEGKGGQFLGLFR